MSKRILVVGGCPRSGTTALVRLLNSHPDILLGDERYYWPFDEGRVSEALFERDRFLDLREEDRHWREGRAPFPPGDTGAAYDRARIVGDKYPPLARAAEAIDRALPRAEIVWIVRNPLSVAESYEARRRDGDDAWHFGAERALADWNDSVRAACMAGGRVLIVTYERLFASGAGAARLFEALGLDPEPARDGATRVLGEAGTLRTREGQRCEDLRFLVARGADWASYATLAEERCLLA